MKGFFIFLLCLYCFHSNANTKEKVIEKGQTTGSFKSFDWGDYAHIEITSNGKDESFFAEGGATTVFEQFEKELKGTVIKVSWEKVKKYIPQADSEIIITRTTDICSFVPVHFESQPAKEKVKLCNQ